MPQPEYSYIALAFCVFWLWTLNRSLISPSFYILRSVIVVAYSFLVMGNQSDSISVIEWLAQFMACSHWFSLVGVFAFPDPRFTRKKSNA
jgi:hypothetical protein